MKMTIDQAAEKIRKINKLIGIEQCSRDIDEAALALYDADAVPEQALSDWAWEQISSLIDLD